MADLTVSANVDTLLQAASFAAFRTSLSLTTLATTTPGTGVATMLATFSSANIATACTDETGSGSLVFATSPTLVTPNIGTPSAGTLSNCTGLAISSGVSGLGTGVASFLGNPTSATLATAISDETGSGALVFGTDPTLTVTTPTTTSFGYLGIPQQSKSADYTLVLTDSGKEIFHPVGDNNARAFTIPANGSVAFPIGTAIKFKNMAAASCTIPITTDTLTLLPAGTTGTRTLAQYGEAVATKITSTSWTISGNSALT